MTNKEVFERYGSENWVIEENLHFLLQMFADKMGVRPDFNTVGFIKNFMKEETIVDIEWAEKARLDHLKEKESSVIVNEDEYTDWDFREL